MRCFIAIPLPSKTQQELSKIQSQLKETEADVKWVEPDNIHLTLKFLGEIDRTKIKTISQQLKELISKYTRFETCMGKLGTFPTLSNPRVIWLDINKNEDTINDLKKKIEEILQPFGLEKETRPFRPHLTLGRVKSKKNIQRLTEAIKSFSFPQSKPFAIGKIVLFQSILKPQGAEYTVLDEFQLKVDPVRDLINCV